VVPSNSTKQQRYYKAELSSRAVNPSWTVIAPICDVLQVSSLSNNIIIIMSSLHVTTIIVTTLLATKTITSVYAFVISSRCCRYDFSIIRKSSCCKVLFAKQQYKQSPDDDEIGSYYYIQFSHAFQRHVVYFSFSSSLLRPNSLNGNDRLLVRLRKAVVIRR
jgi:hypothetical protein